MKQVLTSVISIDDTSHELRKDPKKVSVTVPIDINKYTDQSSTSIDEISDAWYILYWIDQYNILPEKVKEAIRIDPNRSKYFGEFSDSIGALLNIEYVKDNSTVPVSDISSRITGYTYSSILDYIVTPSSNELHVDMSIKTNNIFKHNMTFIKDDTGIPSKLSTTAHGRNLITDSQHYTRLSNAINALELMIKTKLGNMYTVLQFIRSNISDVEFYHKLLSQLC